MTNEPTQYQSFHFPSDGLQQLRVLGMGTTVDGDDAVILSGDIALTTDNVLILAAALQGVAMGILSMYAEAYGAEELIDQVAQLEAELTGQAPLPFPEPETLPTYPEFRQQIAPDIEGRDV